MLLRCLLTSSSRRQIRNGSKKENTSVGKIIEYNSSIIIQPIVFYDNFLIVPEDFSKQCKVTKYITTENLYSLELQNPSRQSLASYIRLSPVSETLKL